MLTVQKVPHITNVSEETAASTIRVEEFPTYTKLPKKPATLILIYRRFGGN
jgi:hypothetical protein